MKRVGCVELCIIYTAFSHSAASIRPFTEKFLVAGAVDLKSVDDEQQHSAEHLQVARLEMGGTMIDC
jgi:hypothetical protein